MLLIRKRESHRGRLTREEEGEKAKRSQSVGCADASLSMATVGGGAAGPGSPFYIAGIRGRAWIIMATCSEMTSFSLFDTILFES